MMFEPSQKQFYHFPVTAKGLVVTSLADKYRHHDMFVNGDSLSSVVAVNRGTGAIRTANNRVRLAESRCIGAQAQYSSGLFSGLPVRVVPNLGRNPT
jgi:hypothetical protein